MCPAGTTPGSSTWQLLQHPGLWALLAAALGVRVRVRGVGAAPCLLGVPVSAVPPAAGSTLPFSMSLGEKPHGRRCQQLCCPQVVATRGPGAGAGAAVTLGAQQLRGPLGAAGLLSLPLVADSSALAAICCG